MSLCIKSRAPSVRDFLLPLLSEIVLTFFCLSAYVQNIFFERFCSRRRSQSEEKDILYINIAQQEENPWHLPVSGAAQSALLRT